MSRIPTGRKPGRPPAGSRPAHEQHAGPEIVTSGRVPDAPDGMGEPGRALWSQLWSAGAKWLDPASDRPLLEKLCGVEDELAPLEKGFAAGSLPRFYSMHNGAEVTHPLVTQVRELRAQWTAWMSAAGFTPSDRIRLGLGVVRVRDELDELADARDRRRAEFGVGA